MGTAALGAIGPATTVVEAKTKTAARLLFIDNIRVFLTILVILQHLMVTYAGTGDWMYMEGRQDFITTILGQYFCAINQAYFMGFFLLIAAFFVPGSYDRKGAVHFIRDRLIRLGIPLVIYSWIIDPLLYYVKQSWVSGQQPFTADTMLGHFVGGTIIGGGPMWFIEILLLFSLLYVFWRVATRGQTAQSPAKTGFPSILVICLLALFIAIATFVVRLFFRVDHFNFIPLNLQFPFFAQYIILFIVGLIAYQRNWLAELTDKTGRMWLWVGIGLILIWAPLVLVGGGLESAEPFKGGWYWQSFVYGLYESIFTISICIGLIYFFRRYLNHRGKVASFLAPNAYIAYIIHGPIIVIIALSLRDVYLQPLLKWLLVALISVPLTFWLGSLVRRLPYTEHIL